MHLPRLLLSAAFLLVPTLVVGEDRIDPNKGRVEKDLVFHDIRQLGVEGQGWTDTAAPFDRLPAKAEKMVRPPVWGLSRNSAGLCVRFVTDARRIDARWELTSKSLAMVHMPATGVSGLDLYVRDPKTSRLLWLGVGRPQAQSAAATLATGLSEGKREFLLYLPLYNGVSKVEIGIPTGSSLWKAAARPEEKRKPIVFYGTSITQGGCASRPGMVHTAIIGRKLDRPVINLGFSGNGRMEPELAALLAEIDAAVFVIDCLPNLAHKDVTEKTAPLVRTLRKARPNTPILLVEDRYYSNSHTLMSARKHNDDNHIALKAVFDELKKDGVKNLHYLSGADLLADDYEGTVDGSHPTDLGFAQHADAFLKVLTPILSGK